MNGKFKLWRQFGKKAETSDISRVRGVNIKGNLKGDFKGKGSDIRRIQGENDKVYLTAISNGSK